MADYKEMVRLMREHVSSWVLAGYPGVACGRFSDAADAIQSLLRERDRLRAELEAARKDAERYRWLRDVGNVTFPSFVNRPSLLGHVWPTSATQVDEALDAAIASQQKRGAEA